MVSISKVAVERFLGRRRRRDYAYVARKRTGVVALREGGEQSLTIPFTNDKDDDDVPLVTCPLRRPLDPPSRSSPAVTTQP